MFWPELVACPESTRNRLRQGAGWLTPAPDSLSLSGRCVLTRNLLTPFQATKDRFKPLQTVQSVTDRFKPLQAVTGRYRPLQTRRSVSTGPCNGGQGRSCSRPGLVLCSSGTCRHGLPVRPEQIRSARISTVRACSYTAWGSRAAVQQQAPAGLLLLGPSRDGPEQTLCDETLSARLFLLVW